MSVSVTSCFGVRLLVVGLAAVLLNCSLKASDGQQRFLPENAPQSEFIAEPRPGIVDPFFPNSERRRPKIQDSHQVIKRGPDVTDLALKGITVNRAGAKLALINNLNLAEGESGPVKTAKGAIKIQVLEIRDKSVLLRIEGIAEPYELHFSRDF